MAVTKEQLQQVKQTWWTANQQFEQNKKIQQDLEKTIKTWNFTAEQAKQYNQMTWNQQGARNLALTSQPAVTNDNWIKTAVTQQEAQMMKDSWITKVDKQNITADQTTQQENFDVLNPVWTKTEDIKPIETTKVTTQNTPTWTIKTTETPVTTNKIENIDQYKKAGGGLSNLEQLVENRYWTIATQNPDWSLTADINWEKFKWTIDSKWNPVKTSLWKVETTNPEWIYQTLVAGWQVDPNSQWYKEALARFNSYNKYKDFTDSQFQTAFTEWLILPWTQIYNDLAKNPKVKLQMDKANALNRVNGEKVNENKVFENQSEEIWNNTKININWKTTTLKSALEDWYISQSEYNQMTNTPEVIAKTKEIEVLKNKVDELQSIYDNVRLEVESELKGTWATRSDLESLVWERQRNMLWWLNLAMSKYNNAIWTLTELKKASSEQFATNLSLYSQQQARQYQLEDRKYSEDLQTKQLEQRYAYENGDLNSTNPTLQNIAIQNAVESMYKNYPIPWMESQSVKVQKIKDLIAKWISGTQAISQVENEIRNSQRYKDYLANEKAKITPQSETKYWFDNVWNGVIAVTDPKTWNVTFKSQTINWTDDLNWLSKIAENNIQCWKAVNTYIQDVTWNYGKMWDTLDSKIKAIQDIWESAEPVEWWIFVSNPLNNKVGHTWIIQSVNNDWSITVLEANREWKTTWWPLVENTYTAEQVKNMKFSVNPKKDKQYTDEQIWELAYLVELQEKNPTQASKDMKDLWYSPKDIANYKAWNMPLTEKQKNSSIEIMDTIKNLVTNYEWQEAVWKFDPSRLLWLQDAEDANVIIKNLVAKMTIPNLWVLKWPMSDKDIDFIKEASTNLWEKQSNKSFEKNLINAYNLSARRAWLPEITKLSEIKSQTPTTTPTQSTSASWNKAQNYLNSLWY